jgi:hypothetical protein
VSRKNGTAIALTLIAVAVIGLICSFAFLQGCAVPANAEGVQEKRAEAGSSPSVSVLEQGKLGDGLAYFIIAYKMPTNRETRYLVVTLNQGTVAIINLPW